jgi:hypothetical protein
VGERRQPGRSLRMGWLRGGVSAGGEIEAECSGDCGRMRIMGTSTTARARGGGYAADMTAQATSADRVGPSGRERRGKRGRGWDGPTGPKGRGRSGHGLI